MSSRPLTLKFLFKGLRRLKWKKLDLIKFQDEHLRHIVQNAFENVAFYRRLFKSKGIHPSDIRGMRDLYKIPIINKTMMKKYPLKDLISKEYDPFKLKSLSTGGSTGKPFTIYISKSEDAWRKAIYLRANISCGQRPRDKWVALIDPQYSSGKNWLERIFGIYFRNIVPVTFPKIFQYEMISKINPEILDGFPNSLVLLGREKQRRGDVNIQPRMIFGSGELVDKDSIDYLEKVFSAPYFDQFGCTEIDRSAWQCIKRQGYHLDCDSVITQFVDQDGSEVCPEEKGEIVYTSLFNYAFPIIRYNVEDIGIQTEDECACGVNLPLMKLVEGRRNSFLVFPDDKIVSPMRFIETLGAFRLEKEIYQYQVVQKTKTNITIYIKKVNDKVNEKILVDTLKKNLDIGFSDMPSFYQINLA
ncbi:MAG: hypothetical protein QG670_2692, partial [Thermoproteota archaeon]|nr:hypothetical protein [Thermoproteota archaeon]